MNFPALFVGIVLMAVIAPTQFAELGTRLATGLFPIIKEGFVVAIIFVGIMIIVGKVK